MSGYTPGPWFATDTNVYHYQNGSSEMVAYLDEEVRFNELSDDEAEAEVASNARLVAAAPELLEAAKRLMDLTMSVRADTVEQDIERLRRAVAKAGG